MTNDRINILLIEDEAILAMDLADQLETEGYFVVGVANNGRKALELFAGNTVDLVLCDITIKGDWDGIETIRQLSTIRQVPVIYLTALADRATIGRAKETFPAAYITKPFNLMQLRLAIEMAINNFSGRVSMPQIPDKTAAKDGLRPAPILKVDNALFIKQQQQFVKVPLQEILFLEADDIYTTVVTRAKKYVVRLPLSHMLERLQYNRLTRTHRSFVVNLDRIESFSDHDVMVAGHSVPLGRNYKEEFMRHFPVW
ncbi:LytR/AlgR family response regulator transcription factor [Spirosoma montaniterrae]|uniref:LytTR family transcriptional regulator n=1 Tax=Spirosoma montaniterrae TaxID=1178516 RepID=A0A1P9WYJ0_9BACT|nr:response regulator [Spirosoma montaniterrae]AQG80447.1 LytTR family transcriptional regulator [Spirosoma montaniterrae]